MPVIALTLILAQLILLPSVVSAFPGIWGTARVTTQPATNITPYSATLNASITWAQIVQNNSAGNIRPVSDTEDFKIATFDAPTAKGYFRYGTSSAALTSSTPQINVPWGTPAFAQDIVSLYPCNTYYAQAVLIVSQIPTDFTPSTPNYLIALFSANGKEGLAGLGAGLNQLVVNRLSNISPENQTIVGNIISFTTPGCVYNTPSHNASGSGLSGGTVGLSNITVQTASLSATKVAPGEKVDIMATVANSGTVNGDTRVTLYINGYEVESKGLTVNSGQSTPVHFFVSQNKPGTYDVQVGGVSAGSFTVDMFNNNDILIYGIIALLTISIAGTLLMLTRKRSA